MINELKKQIQDSRKKAFKLMSTESIQYWTGYDWQIKGNIDAMDDILLKIDSLKAHNEITID